MSTIIPIVGLNNQGRVKEKASRNTKTSQRAALCNISNANLVNQDKPKNLKESSKVLQSVDIEEKNDVVEVIEVIEDFEEEMVESNEFEQVVNDMNDMRIHSRGVGILNIDREDTGNPQLVAEYVNDIYAYLRYIEPAYLVRHGVYVAHPDISGKMRAILIDWLISVHSRFQLLQETLFLAVSIIDRYLQDNSINRQNLQLVGVAALWIASKYEEMYSPELADFVYITDDAYTKLEVRQMECTILRALDFRLGGPLPIHFLRRFSKAGQVGGEVHTLAKYLIELALPEHDMVHYPPSMMSAAALLMSLRIQENSPWSPTLEHYSMYTEDELRELLRRFAILITNFAPQRHTAIRTKYGSSKYFRVSRSDRLTTSPYVLSLLKK